MRQAALMRQARAQGRPLARTIVFATLNGAALIGQAALLANVINSVFLLRQTLDAVAPLLVALLGVALVRAGLAWAGDVAAQEVSAGVRTSLRERLVARVFAWGPLGLADERSGELANTIVNGVEALDAYYSQYLPQAAIAALIPTAILVVVMPFDMLSGVLLLITAPLIPVFGALVGSLSSDPSRAQWSALSRFSARFLDVTQGLTTLKLFGRSRRQAEILARLGEEYRAATMKTLRVAFLSALALELVSTLSVAVIAVEIGLRLLYGDISFTRAFFVLLLAPEFYLPLRALGAKFHAAMSGVTASERIFAALGDAGPGAERAPEPARRAAQAAPDGPPAIIVAGLRYTYPGATHAALEEVSLSVPAGAHIALVGPSGAGKSTLINLLLRFADPDAGEIRVNGESLAAMDPRDWRKHVSWVGQRPYLFHGSVAENILLAQPEASAEEVQRAAIAAQADTFIHALPRGYDTPVGEQGVRLSGGQAQRIALARAFLRDAPLLLLDEPTAQLDPEHEAQITESVARLTQGRTTLVIAHRLSTVVSADLIVVMDAGRIVDAGSHEELRRRCPLYQRLIAAALEEAA
ncbi:MAG TPA: thiol reductant ABC exporter subunit CydD [Ktedonobacterales bacterium]|jgi:thiol reductant ABC exporter CydD subunit|nr:thiol reductant ABC exporter subunit CydD [Ktedonobacterales bacterium]